MSASLQTNRRLLFAILHQSRPHLNLSSRPYASILASCFQSISTAPAATIDVSSLHDGYFDRKVKERQTKKAASHSQPAREETHYEPVQHTTQVKPSQPSKPGLVPRKHRPNTMRLDSVVPPEQYGVDSDGIISGVVPRIVQRPVHRAAAKPRTGEEIADMEPRRVQRATAISQGSDGVTIERGESLNVARGHVIAVAAENKSPPFSAPTRGFRELQRGKNDRRGPSFPARSSVQRQKDTLFRSSGTLRTAQGRKPFTSSPPTQPAQSTPPSPKSATPSTDPKLEPWRVQKAALIAKFAETGGWNPRKRLSPETIDGIRHLHETEPLKHTTEALAKEFKISPEAIRRILKSRWRPSEAEAEDRAKRWARRHDRIWDIQAEMGLRKPRGGKERAEEDPAQWEQEMGRREVLRAYGHNI